MHKISKLEAAKFFLIVSFFTLFLRSLIVEFGLMNGMHVGLLAWSFFILCTPATNGGVIIDIPFYVMSGKRMAYSEIGIWIAAIIFNALSYVYTPSVYFKNSITHLLHQIISNPFPYWFIIALCFTGTMYTAVLTDASRRFKRPIHRGIFAALSIISLCISLVLCFHELIIIINTHGNP